MIRNLAEDAAADVAESRRDDREWSLYLDARKCRCVGACGAMHVRRAS